MKSSTKQPAKNYAALAGFVAVCLAAGFFGSLVTAPRIPTWYASLEKPAGNPPSWVFAPVWTTLYILMAVAAWLVWRRVPSLRTPPLVWFWMQLALNTIWSLIFFGLERPGLALLDIGLLWLAIAVTITVFRRFSGTAALLLSPYLAWVTFAAYLNFGIWRLNP